MNQQEKTAFVDGIVSDVMEPSNYVFVFLREMWSRMTVTRLVFYGLELLCLVSLFAAILFSLGGDPFCTWMAKTTAITWGISFSLCLVITWLAMVSQYWFSNLTD